ncbi:MAG TPA: hypothetical protein VMV01_22130 [Planctomycetota bacterium]|nr:hypothetical protein [Planctomycetota bacterium]
MSATRRHFFLWDVLSHERRCLWCGGADVHPSTQPLRVLGALRFETWRCGACGRRFPLRSGAAGAPHEIAEVARRRRPAGRQLRALDDTLAKVLKPGLGEDD